MTVRLHGASKYANDGCRCDTCKAANTERISRRTRVRMEQLVISGNGRPLTLAEVEHGYSAYKNWGCRCEVCTAANSAKSAARRARVRAAVSS